MGVSQGHRRQLEDAFMGLIWDHLNTKIIKDSNEVQTIENIELMSPKSNK